MAASKPTGAFLASMRGHFPGMPEAQRCTWDSNAHLKCAPRPCANKDGGRLVMTEEDFVPEADEAKKGESKTKKNPRREAAPARRGTVYFDMDETLLHSVEGGRAGLPRIKVGPFYYGVAVRPDAMDALLEAAKHAHVNVLTTADRQYALKALDAAGLVGPGSPIRKVYSTREPDDVPPPSGPWVLLDNDPDSAAEKTQVLVGYNDFERVTIVPDYLAQPRAGRTSLLTGLKKALRKLASRN